MSIESDIYSVLTGDAAFTALVGTRLFTQTVPQDAPLPAVAYQRISTDPIWHLDGADSTIHSRFAFTVMCSTYLQSIDVTQALRSALEAADIIMCLYQDESDLFDFEARKSGRVVDFYISKQGV